MLTNLIDNAVKYSDPPIEVRVEAQRDGRGRTTIAVTDHGIGLERADLRRVFGRFYRVESEAVRRRRGRASASTSPMCWPAPCAGRLDHFARSRPGHHRALHLGPGPSQDPAARGREP
ncbi:MAG: sensor histidine kinase [bacterium]